MTVAYEAFAGRLKAGAKARVDETASSYASQTLRGTAALAALAPEWKTLETGHASGVLPHDALLKVSRACEAETRIVTVRHRGALVLAWPFSVSRQGPLRKAVRLGRAVQCYDDVLATDRAMADGALETAWRAMAAGRGVDLVSFSHVRAGSRLLRLPAIADQIRPIDRAPCLDLRGFADADAYRATLSKNRRGGLKRKRARLAKSHRLAFRPLHDPGERRDAVARALAFKRGWLDAQHLVSAAFTAAYFEAAFLEIVADPALQDAVKVFAFAVDDEIVAVEIGLVNGTAYNSHIGAFSPDWARDGVGALLTEAVIGWCIQERLTRYDMLLPDTPFKRDWTRQDAAVYDALIPLTRRGALGLPLYRDAKSVAKTLQDALPAPVRRVAKAAVSKTFLEAR